MTSGQSRIGWRSIVSRAVMFCVMWWVLTGGSSTSWQIGAPAVVLATAASIVLIPPANIAWLEFLLFWPFFLLRSLLGGVDVAWRAFHPGLPIDPDIVEYELRLPEGLPRVFMANTVTLLPGTLCAAIDNNTLKVHVLSRHAGFRKELEVVERRVARVFGVRFESS